MGDARVNSPIKTFELSALRSLVELETTWSQARSVLYDRWTDRSLRDQFQQTPVPHETD
jgi:hypothetical protein